LQASAYIGCTGIAFLRGGGIFELLIDIESNIVDYLTFLYIICLVYQLIMI